MKPFTQKFAALLIVLFAFSSTVLNHSALAQDNAAAPAGTDANGNPPPPPTHKMLVGLFAGATSFSTSVSSHTTQFDYGGHISIDAFDLGNFSKMAFGFGFDNTNLKNSGLPGTDDLVSYGTVVAQAIFRDVAGSGLYFGPEAGFTIVSLGNVATDAYTFGAEVGYDWHFCHHLSLAPEVHYDRNGPANLTVFQVLQSNLFKAILALNYHFE